MCVCVGGGGGGGGLRMIPNMSALSLPKTAEISGYDGLSKFFVVIYIKSYLHSASNLNRSSPN